MNVLMSTASSGRLTAGAPVPGNAVCEKWICTDGRYSTALSLISSRTRPTTGSLAFACALAASGAGGALAMLLPLCAAAAEGSAPLLLLLLAIIAAHANPTKKIQAEAAACSNPGDD